MKYEIIENQIVDTSTGEIISKKDILNAQKEYILKEFSDFISTAYNLDEEVDIKITKCRGKIYNCRSVKENYTFNKVFRGDVKMLYENVKLSVYAHAFISRFSPYINFPFNDVVINCENPKIEKLCELLDVKKTKMKEILNELEKYDIIKRVHVSRQIVIYFNPFLFNGGSLVHEDTYKLFQNSIFNPSVFKELPTID